MDDISNDGDIIDKKITLILAIVVIAVVAVAAFAAINNGNNGNEPKYNDIAVDESLTVPEDSLIRVFGNVNGDDKVDDKDVQLLKDILSGKTTQTYFADVNQDGVLNKDDINALEALIDGKDTVLYYLNYNLDKCKVHVPVGKINVVYYQVLDAVVAIGAFDKVTAVDDASYNYGDSMYPGITGKTKMKTIKEINAEDLMSTGAKVTVTGSSSYYMDGIEKNMMDGYDVVRLCNSAGAMGIVWHIATLGYILGCDDGASKYIEFFNGTIDNISSKLSNVTDKPTSLAAYVSNSVVELLCPKSGVFEATEIAGTKNLEADHTSNMYDDQPDAQLIYQKNPDWFIVTCGKTGLNTDQAGLISKYQNWMDLWKIDNTLDAVANGKTIAICYNLLNGMMLPIGTQIVASIIYPDLFDIEEAMEMIQDYYDNFTLMDVDASTGGWLYIPSA